LVHTKHVYLQYEVEGIAPSAIVKFAPDLSLAWEQEYDIFVDLVLPTSDRNYALGNFMVKVELLNEDGQSVHVSSRPAILQYESPVQRLARTLTTLPLLLINWHQEVQSLSVMLFESFVQGSDIITSARVSVGNSRLEVEHADLSLVAHLHGLRYMMYYWKLPTAAFFIILFFAWSIGFAAVGWRILSAWWNARVLRESEDAMEFEGEGAEAEEEEDDKMYLKKLVKEAESEGVVAQVVPEKEENEHSSSSYELLEQSENRKDV